MCPFLNFKLGFNECFNPVQELLKILSINMYKGSYREKGIILLTCNIQWQWYKTVVLLKNRKLDLVSENIVHGFLAFIK